MRDPYEVVEEDRSLPIQLPPHRPMTYDEQRKLWVDIIPEPLRRGPQPERGAYRSDDDYLRAVDDISKSASYVLAEHGWLLNRLDWDREYLRGVPSRLREEALTAYGVPDCCQPGHRKRQKRSSLEKLRVTWHHGRVGA